MRTHKIEMLGLLAAAFMATGCLDNDLELTNPNQRTTANFWITEADAISGMNAVYNTLYDNGLYGRNRYWVWGATDCTLSRSPAGAIQAAVRGNILDYGYGGFLDGMWEDPWRGIFKANQVITELPEMDFDQALKTRLIAEAKFIRALYHAEETLLFGDIPIILEVSTAEDEPEYRDQNDVYRQVITDATEAAADLPWTYTGDDVGRATRGGALALAAETHMMLGEWAQGAALLQQIVSSGMYSLDPDFANVFLPAGENGPGSLFEVQFGDAAETSQGARGNINPRLVAPSSGLGSTIGFNDIQPSPWCFFQFFEEGSYPDEPDPRLQHTIFWNDPNVPGGKGMDVFGMPMADRYATTGPGGGPGFRDAPLDSTWFFKKGQEYYLPRLNDFFTPLNVHVYRYGGALILLAEALAETGDVAGAKAALDQVRDRVDLPPVPGGMSQAEMRAWIDRAHIMELFWEQGARRRYLIRHNLFNKASLLERNEFIGETFVDGKNEVIPIDQAEVDRNPNAVQNPGW